MNFQEAMAFISSAQRFGQNLGLSRMECMLKALGNPHRDLKVIHVAGTNGKGSTSAMICQMLMARGYTVGLYTSPFIENFEERIQINRQNIQAEDFARHAGKVQKAMEYCLAQGEDHPTEFELITTVMFSYFQEKAPDYCVVEVGLGGDNDSTNVVDPLLSVIVSISYDHMNVLGNSLTEIASSKAGIIKPNRPVVSAYQAREARLVLERVAKDQDAPLDYVDIRNTKFLGFDEAKGTQQVAFSLPKGDLVANLSLLGVHQWMNALLALTAFQKICDIENLDWQAEPAAQALSQVNWMGRFEIMHKDPLVIIDGAHNVDGIAQLKRSLDFYYPHRSYVLILGILADKDTHTMADIIARDAKQVLCVTPNSDRASLAKDLYDYIVSFNDRVTWFEDYGDALTQALAQLEADDFIIAAGSLYMIGDLRRLIRQRFNPQQ